MDFHVRCDAHVRLHIFCMSMRREATVCQGDIYIGTHQGRAVREVHIAQWDPGCEQPRGGAAHKDAVRVQACMRNVRICSGACSVKLPSTQTLL